MPSKNSWIAATLLATVGLFNTQSASAQPTSVCPAHDYSAQPGLHWFLGMNPADDVLTAWCRMQALPGKIRFNVWFPETDVHRSWNTTFEGAELSPTTIIELIQSLLPTSDGPAKDAEGMEFPKVLKNVQQLGGDKFGFAPSHPAAKELILDEILVLRARPVALAGQEFTLTVSFRPNLGLMALALQGNATDLMFNGWKGRMDTGGLFGRGCSAKFPACEDVPEVATFHTPWLIDRVRLVAEGDNMTSSAMSIMNQLAAGRSGSMRVDGPTMDEKSGRGNLRITDGRSTLEMKTVGSSGGTTAIEILWHETGNGLKKHLNDVGERYRAGEGTDRKSGPSVPDSMGLL